MILALAWVADLAILLTGVALVARALTARYRPAPVLAVPRPRSRFAPTRVIDGRTYPSVALQRTLDEGREYDRQQAAQESP